MVASDGFAGFLRDQLAPVGRITVRRMFGKTGVFCDGFMLGMVRDNTLYFRVDDDNRVAFKEARVLSASQLSEEGRRHRSLLLARSGAAVRRTRRACHLGASSTGGGATGRCEERTCDAKAKIKASIMNALKWTHREDPGDRLVRVRTAYDPTGDALPG